MIERILGILLTTLLVVGCASPDEPSNEATRTTPPPLAGMTYTSFDSAGFRIGKAAGAMEELVTQTAATWINICCTEYWDPSAQTIAPSATGTSTQADLALAITEAQTRGLKVMLTPHVDVVDGSWRAGIEPTPAWFSAYLRMIVSYADVAERMHCNMLCIGTEFVRATQPAYTQQWMTMIDSIRMHYHGALTYAANWNGYAAVGVVADEYAQIGFWSALDYIGIDWYAPVQDFAARRASIKALSSQLHLPVVITESGCPSVAGAQDRPWDYASLITTGAVEDQAAQQQYYDAVIDAFGKATWCEGIFWWNWESIPTALEHLQYTPRRKKAAASVRAFYSQKV